MTVCIFCLQDREDITDEHVFPAALGGTLVVQDCVCAECNHGFSKFEQPLAQELTPLRLLLKIPDRRGKIRDTFATAKTATNEYQAKVKADGTVHLKPVVTKTVTPEGKKEYLHQFLTPKAKEKLAQEAKEKGYEFVETEPGEPIEAEIHVGGELEEIGSLNGLRVTAKIAFVGMAYKTGPKFASGEAFTDIRKFVLDGAGQGLSRQFVNTGYMAAVQQGPHQHSLTLAARKDKARVDAIVRLFGGLCYFVVLSSSYVGPDFCETIVFDAHRGQRDGILLSSPIAELLQTEDVLTNPATVWDDVVASGTQFCSFLEAAIAAKQKSEAATKNALPNP